MRSPFLINGFGIIGRRQADHLVEENDSETRDFSAVVVMAVDLFLVAGC